MYGPPGTSKTYSATIIAAKLLAGSDRVDTQNPYNSAQELLKNEYKAKGGDVVKQRKTYIKENNR